MSFFEDVTDFFENLGNRLRGENEERRREDTNLETSVEYNLLSATPGEVTKKPQVVKVNFQPKENALKHNCEKYELVTRGKGTAIIRRGASFTLEVEFNGEADLKKKQLLRIYFNFGPRPLVNKGTQGVLELSGKRLFDKNHEEWDHRVISETGNKALIEINVPHDVPVGVWKLIFETKSRDDANKPKHVLRLDSFLYILFNPWFKHDDVYMDDEEKRQEYVLNDVGKIWVGGFPTARGRHWVFGQFDDAVLPACVLLMEKSGLTPDQRGNPIAVSRAVSKMVNSNDDNGLLIGRWDGKYSSGTSPSIWSGSIKIMEQYLQTGRGVKYGQCWVFSGLTTTVCRCLGIPCRSVTNLNSAHDTNMSLTIDKYVDKEGNDFKPTYGIYPGGLRDSIWNFHVWNDAWMTRPDLPPGYGGWQVIDATPQEVSHGIFQCGPASLEAIRCGQTEKPYDVNFVLAEVNADVVRWQTDENAQDGFRKLHNDKKSVGVQLLTKKLGKVTDDFFSRDREDITQEYKPREGSKAERVTLHAAARKTRAARHAFRFPSIVDQDVELELHDVERVPIGEDFAISVKAKNISDAKRTVYIVLSAASEYYTGIKAEVIKKAEGSFVIPAGETQTLNLKVTFSEYYDKLVEYAMIKLTAIANVIETTQTWIDEDDFQILKPSLKIEIHGNGVVGESLPVAISFKNPLHVTLTDCRLVVDGPGLTRPKTVHVKDVPPKELMKYELNVFPNKEGSKCLIATFNSKQLVDLTGSTSCDIA